MYPQSALHILHSPIYLYKVHMRGVMSNVPQVPVQYLVAGHPTCGTILRMADIAQTMWVGCAGCVDVYAGVT